MTELMRAIEALRAAGPRWQAQQADAAVPVAVELLRSLCADAMTRCFPLPGEHVLAAVHLLAAVTGSGDEGERFATEIHAALEACGVPESEWP